MKERLINHCLLSYGFLPLLTTMNRLESEQEFEWCAIIIKVLKIHSEVFGIDIPTQYSGEAVAQMKINFMVEHNLSGDIAYGNNSYYADEIIDKIKNID